MFFRIRTIIKYLIFLSILWILYGIFLKSRSASNETAIDQELINKLVEKAKQKQKEIETKKEKEPEKKIENSNKKDDHDHPEEERKKSEEQKMDLDRKVQVNAPVIHDLNAPGN